MLLTLKPAMLILLPLALAPSLMLLLVEAMLEIPQQSLRWSDEAAVGLGPSRKAKMDGIHTGM